MVARKGRR